jgi:hypothetical protein
MLNGVLAIYKSPKHDSALQALFMLFPKLRPDGNCMFTSMALGRLYHISKTLPEPARHALQGRNAREQYLEKIKTLLGWGLLLMALLSLASLSSCILPLLRSS